MDVTTLGSMLLSSTDPERLGEWYVTALEPEEDTTVNGYRMLNFGGVRILIDSRDDITAENPQPGRLILNFHVPDARAVAARLDEMRTRWVAELEDREGSIFGTAIDPDGNYIQIVEMSEEALASM